MDPIDFNAALRSAGDFGLYQKLLCALLVIPSASLCALVYFSQFFILLVGPHTCRYGNSTENVTLVGECEMIVNGTQFGCDGGWEYDFTEYFPTIATELDWVCEKDRLPYQSQTIFYVGTSLGCIFFGLIADRYGRRPSIVLSYTVACVAGIATAFTSNFYTFNFLRFLVGATIIPLSEDPYVLSLEYIGVEKRTLAIILWSLGYIVFSAICPWIAYALRDWRLLCIITSVPLAIVPLAWKFVPESASWLLTRGRRKEAVLLLQRVASINGKGCPDELAECYVGEKSLEDEERNEEKQATALDLFRTPRMRRNNLVLAITWFIVYCCYHTNTQNAAYLGTDVYDSFTYSSLVELPSLPIILFGVEWAGRKAPLTASALLAAIAGLTVIMIPANAVMVVLLLSLVQRVSLTVAYNVIMQYSAELLPTVVRGRGLAFLRLMGTLGLYLAPSIVYLSQSFPGLPLVVCGVLMLVVGGVVVSLPETLHQHLPHSLKEGEAFGRDQPLCLVPAGCCNSFRKKEAEKDYNAVAT